MHKHYARDKIPETVPIIPEACQTRNRSGAVLELDIVRIEDIKIERVGKGEVTGLTYSEVFDEKKVHYRPVAQCVLSNEHARLMGVSYVWVDMDGLAADDACENLLETCVLSMRRARPNASKDYIKLLASTQIAWAGSGTKNEENAKVDESANTNKPAQEEEKKEE